MSNYEIAELGLIKEQVYQIINGKEILISNFSKVQEIVEILATRIFYGT